MDGKEELLKVGRYNPRFNISVVSVVILRSEMVPDTL